MDMFAMVLSVVCHHIILISYYSGYVSLSSILYLAMMVEVPLRGSSTNDHMILTQMISKEDLD